MPILLNSLWQGWSCGLVHCPGGNATDPIWRVLASSDEISSWTPLKPQHSNPNPLANQLWCILTSLLLPHLPLSLTDSLPSLNYLCHSKTDAWFKQDASKTGLKHSRHFCGIFSKLKTEFYCHIVLSEVSDCIFEIHAAVTIRALVGCIPNPTVAVHLNLKS